LATTHQQNNNFNSNQMKQLRQQGYTDGLAKEMLLFTKAFPLRFWVVDNSGSMSAVDGKRLVNTKNQNTIKMVTCSRWKEIQETVEYHAQMAGLLEAPTIFRLLNNPGNQVGPQEFSVATTGPELIQRDLQVARDVMQRGSPMGVTPLASHINEIRQHVHELSPSLFAQGRRVAIILATDGMPTNEYGISDDSSKAVFTQALRSLEGLPVWIVIRLCTDEESIVNFYNDIDAQLELSIEVLDDFIGEAEEVHAVNPWLNYTLVIHRMREMGVQNRLFDLLDERRFTRSEVCDFCRILFGVQSFDGIPDPEVDFEAFMKKLTKIVEKHDKSFHPISQKPKHLIDLKALQRLYANPGCTIM